MVLRKQKYMPTTEHTAGRVREYATKIETENERKKHRSEAHTHSHTFNGIWNRCIGRRQQRYRYDTSVCSVPLPTNWEWTKEEKKSIYIHSMIVISWSLRIMATIGNMVLTQHLTLYKLRPIDSMLLMVKPFVAMTLWYLCHRCVCFFSLLLVHRTFFIRLDNFFLLLHFVFCVPSLWMFSFFFDFVFFGFIFSALPSAPSVCLCVLCDYLWLIGSGGFHFKKTAINGTDTYLHTNTHSPGPKKKRHFEFTICVCALAIICAIEHTHIHTRICTMWYLCMLAPHMLVLPLLVCHVYCYEICYNQKMA